MQVREIMTPNPACCTAETPLEQVARMMVDNDCGEIPIVRTSSDRTIIGVVTDRELSADRDRYTRQLAVYGRALSAIERTAVRCVLVRV